MDYVSCWVHILKLDHVIQHSWLLSNLRRKIVQHSLYRFHCNQRTISPTYRHKELFATSISLHKFKIVKLSCMTQRFNIDCYLILVIWYLYALSKWKEEAPSSLFGTDSFVFFSFMGIFWELYSKILYPQVWRRCTTYYISSTVVQCLLLCVLMQCSVSAHVTWIAMRSVGSYSSSVQKYRQHQCTTGFCCKLIAYPWHSFPFFFSFFFSKYHGCWVKVLLYLVHPHKAESAVFDPYCTGY